jgi:uncharacterized membrane protein
VKALAIAGGVLAAAYPFAVYFGLDVVEPRRLALIVAVVAGLRALQVRRVFRAADLAMLGAIALLAAAVAWSNSEMLLRFYPAVISLGLLASFALTLKRGPSMIERFARLRDPDLGSAGVVYTRRVTQVWCGFFAFNAGIAIYTAIGASREAWLLYNGFVSYLIVAALFAGEWLVRKRALERIELAEQRG